jgi:hypothetical protein
VHYEFQRLRVHLVDQPVETLDFELGIGRVAEDAEGEFPAGQRRERRAAGKQEK